MYLNARYYCQWYFIHTRVVGKWNSFLKDIVKRALDYLIQAFKKTKEEWRGKRRRKGKGGGQMMLGRGLDMVSRLGGCMQVTDV